ncbi:class F sortase [Demequina sp. SYSU T00192]|uniref:Class F sortase n=1 Tax=Demequina litoralis TaxID=3051660 RepID=A0ABT8G868_9MICO|nr:class F sortase [Demequina sp. SYSU T00192]MDN4475328.1 class F sortase [Demequina sp. SYSU T00192]
MRLAALALAALMPLGLSACSPAGAQTEPTPAASVAPAVAEIPAIAAGPVAGQIPVRRADVADLAAAPRPSRLVVDRLGIDVRVRGVGLDADGSMELPSSAEVAGWFRAAGNPGGGLRGGRNAVIAAHVDDAVVGLGPFARLREARPGDRLEVVLDDGGSAVYRVERVEQTDKRDVDLDAVFASPDGALVLVTCGGRWDADVQHYEDNVLVWALPEDDSR